MTLRAAEEVFYETEATLRLVDNILDELQGIGVELGKPDVDDFLISYEDDDDTISEIAPIRVYREVQDGLRSIRHSRTILERSSEGQNGNVRELGSNASATDALDGLDRVIDLLARIEAGKVSGVDRTAAFAAIRSQVGVAVASLQHQDVTEQQLSYASSILLDTEGRFSQLSDMLDPHA